MNGVSRVASKLIFNSSPPLSPTQCISLLQAFSQSKSLRKGKQLHAYIVTSGLLPPSTPDSPHRHLPSSLASMYALCGDAASARLLFDHVPQKTSFLWNSLIRGHVQSGISFDALYLFERMVSAGDCPDRYTFIFVLKACADLSLVELGMQVHCRALASGFGSNVYLQNSLISLYMSGGDKEKARKVFDAMCERTVVSWNTMIAGLVKKGCAREALGFFDRMLDEGEEPDRATVVSVLPACASLKDLQRGRLVHKLVLEKRFGSYLPARNSLIDMYAKCESLEEARRLFDDEMYDRDVVSWTAMIGGYVLNGRWGEALSLSHDMQTSCLRPNSLTVVSMLSACSNSIFLRHGKCIHVLCIRLYLATEIIVETALIDMYGRCGNMNLSSLVFVNSSRRTAAWNAIISCYCRNGMARESIEHLKLMLVDAVKPDATTIMSVLPAYSDLVDLQQARNIHSFLIKMGFREMVEVVTCLIDLYSKIGSLDTALELFVNLPTKDVVAWSAIIAGYGLHGHARTAIELFNQMVESGVEPNEVTFTSILYSCSHAGLVDEGLHFFKSMSLNYHMKPGADHYACIVDLLGRAGRLVEAHALIRGMACEANHAVWGALLGACVIHGNIELGEEAARHLFELESENTGNYVLLRNLYAAVGRWEDAENVRTIEKERGLRKTPGCSLIEGTHNIEA